MSAIGRLYRGENDINFSKWWRWGIRLSLVMFVLSVLSLGFRGLNLGIDFEGGKLWEVKAPGVTIDEARTALANVGESQAKIQQIVTSDILRVQADPESSAKENEVRTAIANLAKTTPSEVNFSTVGPSWGGEVTSAAVRALLVFFVGVLLFLTLTLEFKMALGAIFAVIHDVVISVGVYSIFQFEVTPATVIAFLTILGFSIYDTVVVYDQVKNNEARVGLSSRMTYKDMVSLSMNQVLVRSLNTSIVAIIPVLSLLVVGSFILGAVTLQEFAIALTVGLGVGAYSSIFIAAPALVWMKEREPRNRQLRARLEAQRSAEQKTSDLQVADGDAAVEKEAVGVAPGAAKQLGGSDRTSTRYTSSSTTIPPRPRKKTKKR